MRQLLSLCLLISVFGCASNPAYYQALEAAENENYRVAVGLWQPLAEQGDVRSQFKLGELYHEGLGVSRDIDSAMRVSHRINAAAVMINDHTAFRVDWMRFAGFKESGYGVGGIPYTLHDMQVEKQIVIKSGEI